MNLKGDKEFKEMLYLFNTFFYIELVAWYIYVQFAVTVL